MNWRVIAIVLLTHLIPIPASADLRRVEMKILGMDCATCAYSVHRTLQKLDGVRSVDLSLERAMADIRLKPGNSVTLAQLARIVRINGFNPKEATVMTLGEVRLIGGQITLDVTGTSAALPVVPDSKRPAVYRGIGSTACGGSIAACGTDGHGDIRSRRARCDHDSHVQTCPTTGFTLRFLFFVAAEFDYAHRPLRREVFGAS